jgi:uncharacterized protein (DUF433 family)
MEDWQKYISINPEIRSGKPCISGTRITVSDVLSYLAAGMSMEEIIADFPALDKEKIIATLSIAAYRDRITTIAFAS